MTGAMRRVSLAAAILAERPEAVASLRVELFAELERQADPRVLGKGNVFDAHPSPQPKTHR